MADSCIAMLMLDRFKLSFLIGSARWQKVGGTLCPHPLACASYLKELRFLRASVLGREQPLNAHRLLAGGRLDFGSLKEVVVK